MRDIAWPATVCGAAAIAAVGLWTALGPLGLALGGVCGGAAGVIAASAAVRSRGRAIEQLAQEVRRATAEPTPGHLDHLARDRRDGAVNELASATHAALLGVRERASEVERLEQEMQTRVDEETRRVHAQLSQLSLTDPLTGLANRRGFDERVRELVSVAQPSNDELALIAVDIDHFKKLNDTCGHHKGDEALVALGEVVQRCVREHDLAGRIGGDEIMIALPRVSARQAQAIAQRLVDQFATHPSGAGGDVPWPTLSVGIAMLQGDDAQDSTVLRRMADRALYESKRQGRAQVTRWHAELRAMSQAG